MGGGKNEQVSYRKHPLDQVSRIMHAQHAMKHFLGALGKPAMPQPPATRNKNMDIDQPRVVEETRPKPQQPNAKVCQASFKLRISEPNIDMTCSMCNQLRCSVHMHYIYMPTLAKPWIPVCSACRAPSRG